MYCLLASCTLLKVTIVTLADFVTFIFLSLSLSLSWSLRRVRLIYNVGAHSIKEISSGICVCVCGRGAGRGRYSTEILCYTICTDMVQPSKVKKKKKKKKEEKTRYTQRSVGA